MDQNFQLSCLSQYGVTKLELGSYLNIATPTLQSMFKIDLHLQIYWTYSNQMIRQMIVGKFIIIANYYELNKVKEILDCRVTYRGMTELYKVQQIISQKQSVCVVKNKISGNTYVCKTYRKNNKNIRKALSEIQMLMKLIGQRNIVYLHEIYESQGNLYLIMEKLDHQLFDDYYHEEIQLIAYQLIILLSEFQKLNIAHHNLTQKHIMFDENNNIKLISFGKTSSIKEKPDFFFDMYQTGEILLELYCINKDQLFSKSTYLPDHAVNFIKGLLNLTEYRLNINLAQTHPYFKSLNGESQLVKIRSLLPKRNLSDLKKNKKQQDTDQDQLTIQI